MFWVDHVGVVASDLDASVRFYTRLFGPTIDRVEWRGEDAANVARLMGRPPGPELDAVFFRIPHTNAILELVHCRGIEQARVSAGNADVGRAGSASRSRASRRPSRGSGSRLAACQWTY